MIGWMSLVSPPWVTKHIPSTIYREVLPTALPPYDPTALQPYNLVGEFSFFALLCSIYLKNIFDVYVCLFNTSAENCVASGNNNVKFCSKHFSYE